MKTKMKKIEVNSTENQKIKGKFVEREVLCCFSYEMEAILRASGETQNKDYPLPTWDEIENIYELTCNYCGYTSEKPADNTNGDLCPECEEKGRTEEIEYEAQEIFEWWIVTEYLYDKLKAKGCPVLQWGNNYYWGRCTTGQAILLDGVISDICKEMEILEGQLNDWSKQQEARP